MRGEGKTTLVKLITGELDATFGAVTRDRGAHVTLVNQHHADQLRYDMTPLAFMAEKFPGDGSLAHAQEIRSHLAGCGVSVAQQTVPAGAVARRTVWWTAESCGTRSGLVLTAASAGA